LLEEKNFNHHPSEFAGTLVKRKTVQLAISEKDAKPNHKRFWTSSYYANLDKKNHSKSSYAKLIQLQN
jgi:hypothetical protein